MDEISSEIEILEELKFKVIHKYDDLEKENIFYKTIHAYCISMKNIRTDENKQRIIQSVIDKIEIIWSEELKNHVIKITFKFNNPTSFLLTRELKVKYKSL